MSFLHIRPLLALGALGALFLAGCGGGASPTPNNNGPFTVDGLIDSSDFYDRNDDRYYDIFVTEPSRDGGAEVEMFSRDLDSQLFIYRRASNGDYDLIADNDNGAGGFDARVRFDVFRGEVYRIVATSSRTREFGYYRVFFSRELGRPAVVLPRVDGRTNGGFDLPPIAAKAAK